MSEITEIFTYQATALLLKLNDLLMGINLSSPEIHLGIYLCSWYLPSIRR